MGNTQGSLENPFYIDDLEPPPPPRPDTGKSRAYYEVHDDRPPTELPVDAIPTNLTSATNRTSRINDEVIIIDDDEPCAISRTPPLPVTSPHLASTAVQKKSSAPPPSRLAYLRANNLVQSRETNAIQQLDELVPDREQITSKLVETNRASIPTRVNRASPPSPRPTPKEDSGIEPLSTPASTGRPEEDNDTSDHQEVDLQLDQAVTDVDLAVIGAHVSTPTVTLRDDSSAALAQSPQVDSLEFNLHDANAAAITQGSSEHIEHAESLVSLSELQEDAATDIVVARQKIESTLRHHLSERYEDHAYLVKNLLWRQRTRYERESRAQFKHNPQKKVPMLPDKYIQTESPFQSILAVQSPFQKTSHGETQKVITQDIFANSKTRAKEDVVKSTWSVLICTHKPGDLQIPSFKEYVSLKKSILADNESKLLTMPWMSDDQPVERGLVFRADLPQRYRIQHDINALLDLRNEQCRFYFQTVDSFLTDVGLTWETMLYWLLSPEAYLRRTNQGSHKHSEFERLILDRSPYDRDSFRRDSQMSTPILFEYGQQRWDPLLHQLEEPSAVQLRLIALACAALIANCDFSPWYMAKITIRMKGYVRSRTRQAEAECEFAFKDNVCSVCHEHNCLFHGEIREAPESDSVSTSSDENSNKDESPSSDESSSGDESSGDDESSEDDFEIRQTQKSSRRTHIGHDDLIPAHYDPEDSDVEKVVNYKLPANWIVSTSDERPHRVLSKRPMPPPGTFKPKWWEKHTGTNNWEKQKPFVPCSHVGSCVDAKCRCFRENVTCEKTCKCPSTCDRRFPGCRCAFKPGRRTCSTITGCICKKFKRECDADLCGNCGATEILDPVNRYVEDLLEDRCTNVGIQRGVPKKTLLGKSEVHGFGLYAGQDMRKDDIIGEYTGEILSGGETERREICYHYDRNMYLFNLNKEQTVDATHMGNKLRFINNAAPRLSNCYSKVLFCNTVFRVALCASKGISAGTELFFNYNYPEEMTKYFKQPKGKAVAVKQVVKQSNKLKPKQLASRSSFNKDPNTSPAEAHQDRPWVREGLAKARAAKAARREAMQAGQVDQASATVRGKIAPQPKQARKSASGSSSSKNLDIAGGRGRSGGVQTSHSREGSTTSRSADARGRDTATPRLVVQETDEEINTDAEIRENKATRPKTNKPLPGTARKSVVAVKKMQSTSFGRPKRKRPVIVNSDDE